MKSKIVLLLLFFIASIHISLYAQQPDSTLADSLKVIADTLAAKDTIPTDTIRSDTITPVDTQKIKNQVLSNDTLPTKGDTTQKQTDVPAINPPLEIYQTFGELYERVEFNKGYLSPVPGKPNVDYFATPTAYNLMRSRFGLEFYLRDRFTFRITFQSIKFFGRVPDIYYWRLGLSQPFYEAWGEYYLSPVFSIKAGIMPLSYDNERILGERDWLPQSSSHNAILLKYDDIIEAHVGIAYDFYNPLDMVGSLTDRSYKMLQFAWVGGYIGSMDISFIALNSVSPEIEYVFSPFYNTLKPLKFNLVNLQTFGFYSNIGTLPVYVEAEFYYQIGHYPQDWVLSDSLTAANISITDLNQTFGTNLTDGPGLGKFKNAYMFSISATYENKKIKTKTGLDYLSGDNYLEIGTDNNNIDNAFDPALGSNHKFYGAMDYFYMNSWTAGYSKYTPGLKDFYAKFVLQTKQLNLEMTAHYFKPAGKIWFTPENSAQPTLITDLGQELDLQMEYFVVPEVASIALGGSLLKPTDGLLFLKNFDPNQAKKLYFTTFLSFRLKPTFYKAFKYEHKLVQEFSTSQKINPE